MIIPPLLSRTALLFLLMATGAATAARPAADIILHNGNIITLNDAQPQASALAISGSRIVAIGDDTATNEWRGDHTRTIDLQGKTVIPGLTDTHIHAIRGGQTWTFETYWYDSPSLKDALDKLRADANRRPHDQWVAVVGSWIPAQFAEKPGADGSRIEPRPSRSSGLYSVSVRLCVSESARYRRTWP